MYTYEINESNCIKGYLDGVLVHDQPFDPVTGKPFTTYDEAVAWAEDTAARMRDRYTTNN